MTDTTVVRCRYCGRDINAIGQDNMAYSGAPVCEDCASE